MGIGGEEGVTGTKQRQGLWLSLRAKGPLQDLDGQRKSIESNSCLQLLTTEANTLKFTSAQSTSNNRNKNAKNEVSLG